ncbi:transposase [Streptomyces humi]
MCRHELFDAEWEFVRSLLPASLRGRKRLDDCRVLSGIVWKFRTGTAWRGVLEWYGPWVTLRTCFRRWVADGTFERMLRVAQARRGRTRPASSTGWCRSAPRSPASTSMPSAPEKKGGGSATRSWDVPEAA